MSNNAHGRFSTKDARDYVRQVEQDGLDKIKREKELVRKLAQRIADALEPEDYLLWYNNAPEGNADFLKACEDKVSEIESAEIANWLDEPIQDSLQKMTIIPNEMNSARWQKDTNDEGCGTDSDLYDWARGG
jgi:predicted AAA+ superfamily ATPase